MDPSSRAQTTGSLLQAAIASPSFCDGVAITVAAVIVDGDAVHLHGVRAVVDGQDVGLDSHRVFVNPPQTHVDAEGNRQEDPVAVIMHEIAAAALAGGP